MLYRIRQGINALFAWGRALDLAQPEAILGPQLMALFTQMRRSEQLHSLRVLATVQAMGHTEPDLLVAALLHDVGKTRAPIGLMGRTLAVLVRAALPGIAHHWAQGEPVGWRRALAVAERHHAWGAEMLAEAGASPLAMTLVRRHQEKMSGQPAGEENRLLAVLQAADAAN